MTPLTRERIEQIRESLRKTYGGVDGEYDYGTLCDMALLSIRHYAANAPSVSHSRIGESGD